VKVLILKESKAKHLKTKPIQTETKKSLPSHCKLDLQF